MKNMKQMLLAGLVALALPLAAYAATEVTVQQVVNSGLAPTRTGTGLSTSETYQFTNDGRVFLAVTKTGAGACTVTVVTQATAQGFAIADQTISVAASTGDKIIGPFPESLFNDASGKVQFTLSDTAGLSIAALRL